MPMRIEDQPEYAGAQSEFSKGPDYGDPGYPSIGVIPHNNAYPDLPPPLPPASEPFAQIQAAAGPAAELRAELPAEPPEVTS